MSVTSDTTGRRSPVSPSQPVRFATLATTLAVTCVSALVILLGLAAEPHFADESAMIAQSYYYTLFKGGNWDHPDWLHYAAYDHPPLPKYFFGLSLEARGLPVPGSLGAWMNWIRGDFSPPRDHRVLFWARVPSALFGACGVAAIYTIGLQLHGRLAGLLAASLLLMNPLYLTHARRAMSDSFTECLVIASVSIALWACRLTYGGELAGWRWGVFVVLGSLICGLAALAKLNGGIAALLVLAMLFGTWWLGQIGSTRTGCVRHTWWRLIAAPAAAVLVAICGFGWFVLLNPFLTADPVSVPAASRELAAMHPLERARFLIRFRRDWTRDALNNAAFQADWLRTVPARMQMAMWEGFGRYSPLGPRDIRTATPRAASEQFRDYRRAASLVWFPLFFWGVWAAARGGWSKHCAGQFPQEWGVLLYAAAAGAIVVFMIPLNWDRYYLPIQAPVAALVSYGMVRIGNAWMRSGL